MDAVQSVLIVVLTISHICALTREQKMWGHIRDLWGKR